MSDKRDRKQKQGGSPLELLEDNRELLLYGDCPVALESRALILNRAQGKLYARLSFKNLGRKTVSALRARLICSDVWGRELGEAREVQYLNLSAGCQDSFGMTQPIELEDMNVKQLKLELGEILYADGSTENPGPVSESFPAPLRLENSLGQAAAEQYARECGSDAVFMPMEGKKFWRCSCGGVNPIQEESCCLCGCGRKALFQKLNIAELNEKAQQYNQEREAAQQQEKAAELIKTKAKRKKRRKIIALSAVLAALLLGLLAVFYIIPNYKYSQAGIKLENGSYDEACAIYTQLKGYKDSPELALESRYRKAGALLNRGDYDDARAIYRELGDYSDSQDMLKEADLAEASGYMYNGEYEKAYILLSTLGGYGGADALLDECVTDWADYALTTVTLYTAKRFDETVDLTPEQQKALYELIMDYCMNDSEVMTGDGDGIVKAEVAYTLLKQVPKDYADCKMLFKLTNDVKEYNIYDPDYVEDNEDFLRKNINSPLVLTTLSGDWTIINFLRGHWSGDGYIFNFDYSSDSGLTSSYYSVPFDPDPAGADHFNMSDGCYVLEDRDGNHLQTKFRFEIVDFDTVNVTSYANYQTYTLHRQG